MDNQKKDFLELELDIGRRLSNLTDVHVDEEFKNKLWEDLKFKYNETNPVKANKTYNTGTAKCKKKGLYMKWGAIAVAVLLVITFLPLRETNDVEMSSLLSPTQVFALGGSDLALDAGFNTLRDVRFEVKEALPTAPPKGQIFRLQSKLTTVDDYLRMAKNMGMKNPEVMGKESQESVSQFFSIISGKHYLMVWPKSGVWEYEYRDYELDELDSDLEEGKVKENVEDDQKIDQEMAKAIAEEWLKKLEQLPHEKYKMTVEDTRNSDIPVALGFNVVFIPESSPDANKSVETGRRIRIFIGTEGQVINASYNWPELKETSEIPLADYTEAIEALNRGEGRFNVKRYWGEKGVASIEDVEIGHQLAYGIDYTPYLVPTCIFAGKFTSQETTQDFTASIPLLKKPAMKNAANFAIKTKLPEYRKKGNLIAERQQGLTQAELESLASFFGIEKKSQEENSINGTKGEELHYTSYDYGWLYRGQTHTTTKQLSEEKAVQIAQKIANDIPVVPGTLGKPWILPTGGEEFYTIGFPFIYEGIPVVTPSFPGYVSYIVISLYKDGTLWSVDSKMPMEAMGEKMKLISPQEAKQMLLENDYIMTIDNLFGYSYGDRFAADKSTVTKIELVYIPCHPELARSKDYTLMYRFSGKTIISGNEMDFAAFVRAQKEH
ncbi:MAG: hypothetical protein PHV56_01525 [Clostridia bacterium]|nr:hypothetical protein [Clostridia bacterium]